MSQSDFAAAVLAWHDFYLAAAGATAALLGLLFVGVSINLATIRADERVDLRARAGQAFANLVYVLIIGLVMLIPDPEQHATGISLAAIAVVGIGRVAVNILAIARAPQFSNRIATVRRIAFGLVAQGLLLFVAATLYGTGDGKVIGLLPIAVLVLLIGAADVSWEMLVRVSEERGDP